MYVLYITTPTSSRPQTSMLYPILSSSIYFYVDPSISMKKILFYDPSFLWSFSMILSISSDSSADLCSWPLKYVNTFSTSPVSLVFRLLFCHPLFGSHNWYCHIFFWIPSLWFLCKKIVSALFPPNFWYRCIFP